MNNPSEKITLADLFGEVLENGKESSVENPFVKGIKDINTRLFKTESSSQILTYLTSLNEQISKLDSDPENKNPKMLQELKGSLKNLFEIERAQVGHPVSENTAVNKVLVDNPELSRSLFYKMMSAMVREDSENQKIVD